MNPAIALLLAIEPRPLAALELLHQLYAAQPATVDEVLAVAPDIEAAINEAEKLAERSRQAVNRCLELKPTSAPQTPSGF